MENYKVYVEVTVKFSTDGVMMPVEFIWEDGTKYIIDKVKSKERCASRKAGGTGIMYIQYVNLQFKYQFMLSTIIIIITIIDKRNNYHV